MLPFLVVGVTNDATPDATWRVTESWGYSLSAPAPDSTVRVELLGSIEPTLSVSGSVEPSHSLVGSVDPAAHVYGSIEPSESLSGSIKPDVSLEGSL